MEFCGSEKAACFQKKRIALYKHVNANMLSKHPAVYCRALFLSKTLIHYQGGLIMYTDFS